MAATRIEIATNDGVAPAFLFGDPARPGVILLMDGLGMRPALHEMAARLAEGGYRVLVPDLFYRLGSYSSPDPRELFSDPAVRAAWFARVSITTAAGLLSDVPAYLDHFGGAPVGLTGYCMGGRLAMVAAATYPERIAAAAAYHPGGLVTDKPDSPHLIAGRIQARVHVGGAQDDANFTDEQRATFAAVLAAAGVVHEVELYRARHGWVPSDTPVHDEAATARHWQTLFALLAAAFPAAAR
jgi:carboxymethylenebutenolidase